MTQSRKNRVKTHATKLMKPGLPNQAKAYRTWESRHCFDGEEDYPRPVKRVTPNADPNTKSTQ